MDAREWPEQCIENQWARRPACVLRPGASPDRISERKLRRRLRRRVANQPRLRNWADLRADLLRSALGRELRRGASTCDGEPVRRLQRPPPDGRDTRQKKDEPAMSWDQKIISEPELRAYGDDETDQ